jgi:hypothetical protein
MSKNEIMEIFKGFESLTNSLSAVAPFIFLLAGLGFVLLDRYNAFKLSRRKNINVSAKITKSEVFEYWSKGSDRRMMMYRPVIEYTYEINGQNYQSERITHSAGSFSTSNKSEIEALVSQYSIGKIVSAFVNSENLEDVYLLEKSPGAWIVPTIGCVFILVSFVIWSV